MKLNELLHVHHMGEGRGARESAYYSLRSELLVTKMDVSATKIHLDTFISWTSNSERREYYVCFNMDYIRSKMSESTL